MIAEAASYVYSISKEGLYVHLYGGNTVCTQLTDGSQIKLRQRTDYPWGQTIDITIDEAPDSKVALFLRIPSWTKNPDITLNGKPVERRFDLNHILRFNEIGVPEIACIWIFRCLSNSLKPIPWLKKYEIWSL